MAFEITASRRRPQRFSELSGQNFVVSTLMSSIRQERIAHAYLFSGPRGVGKTSAARILAKSLNCEKGITTEPCGSCPSCHEITAGSALDVIEIDGASNTSVNDIRTIKDEVLFAPNSSRYKIYIIDEVHMLSNSAFNALLKTIEEPPPYVIFIFATTEVHKVPATIRSRCQQFHFQLISLEVIKQKLQDACDESAVIYEEEALFWIAKEATGSLRDAYTLFDQIVSISDGNIRMIMIRDKMGLIGVDVINTLAEHMVDGDRQKAVELLHSIIAQGVSIDKCIIDLTEYFRTALLIKEHITKESILGAKAEHFSAKVIDALAAEQIEGILDLLLNLYRNIRFSLNQRFELELAISRLCSIQYAVVPSVLVRQIKELKEELLNAPPPSRAAQRPKPPAQPAAPKSAPSVVPDRTKRPAAAPEKSVVISAKHIEMLQAQLKQKSPALASTLQQITSWEVEDRTIRFIFGSNFTAERAREHVVVLRNELRTILGTDITLDISTGKDSKQPTREAVTEDDDAIEKVKSIFRGELYTNPNTGE